MACPDPVCIELPSCVVLSSTDIAPVRYITGLDANGCKKFEQDSDLMCRVVAGMSTGNALQIGDYLVGADCQLHQLAAGAFLGLLSGCTTASSTTTYDSGTGLFCVNVSPTWVKSLFNASGDAFVSLAYNPTTGQTSLVTNPTQIVASGLCTVMGTLPAGAAVVYGVTPLMGQDCSTHVVEAQLLSFNGLTRNLTISAGNTVNIPDKYISGFSIAGNVASIVMNDGQLFTATIPMTIDINVQSVSLVGTTLQLTETDGTVHSVTLPDCCPTAFSFNAGILTLQMSGGQTISQAIPDLHVVDFTITGSTLVLTRSDGSVWNVPLPTYPPLACASVLACFIEGRNIDIQPTGSINAGYLRNDGANSYTWINQDGVPVYTFVVPTSTATCADIASFPQGVSVGAGQTINVVGVDCLKHNITIPTICDYLATVGPAAFPHTFGYPNNYLDTQCAFTTIDLDITHLALPPANADPAFILGADNVFGTHHKYEWPRLKDYAFNYSNSPANLVLGNISSTPLNFPLLIQSGSFSVSNTHVSKAMKCVFQGSPRPSIYPGSSVSFPGPIRSIYTLEVSFNGGISYVIAGELFFHEETDTGGTRVNYTSANGAKSFSVPANSTMSVLWRERLVGVGGFLNVLSYREPHLGVIGTTGA
jgi:hypothetical protein